MQQHHKKDISSSSSLDHFQTKQHAITNVHPRNQQENVYESRNLRSGLHCLFRCLHTHLPLLCLHVDIRSDCRHECQLTRCFLQQWCCTGGVCGGKYFGVLCHVDWIGGEFVLGEETEKVANGHNEWTIICVNMVCGMMTTMDPSVIFTM